MLICSVRASTLKFFAVALLTFGVLVGFSVGGALPASAAVGNGGVSFSGIIARGMTSVSP